jgi:hypothetical protein
MSTFKHGLRLQQMSNWKVNIVLGVLFIMKFKSWTALGLENFLVIKFYFQYFYTCHNH